MIHRLSYCTDTKEKFFEIDIETSLSAILLSELLASIKAPNEK
jgi:hypothetical protein